MSNLYDGKTFEFWIDELNKHKEWNWRHALSLFSLFGTPSQSLDVGCGSPFVVEASRRLGIEAYGCDQIVNDEWPDHFFHANLQETFSLHERIKVSLVDHIYCFEVAEHLPHPTHPMLCNSIAAHLKRDDNCYLFFSAAHPGQGGEGHLSERPAKYWHDMFYERGLKFREKETSQLALAWKNLGSPLYWLPANIMVFTP